MAPKRSARQAFDRDLTYDDILFGMRRCLEVDTSADAIAVSPRNPGDGEVDGHGIRGSSASAPANLAPPSMPAGCAPAANSSSSPPSDGASTSKTTPESKAPVGGVAGQKQAKELKRKAVVDSGSSEVSRPSVSSSSVRALSASLGSSGNLTTTAAAPSTRNVAGGQQSKKKRKTVVESGSSEASRPTVTLSSAPVLPGDAGHPSSFATTSAVPAAPTPAVTAAAVAATTAAFQQHDWTGVVDLRNLPGWRGQFRDLFTGRIDYIGGESREDSETIKDSTGEARPTKRARKE